MGESDCYIYATLASAKGGGKQIGATRRRKGIKNCDDNRYYVNPDGTKKPVGDVIYFKDGAHHYGIDVTLGTIRLTREEFNSWIVDEVENKRPDVFIGVGASGLLVLTWKDFRELYVRAVRAREPSWEAKRIESGYGPLKRVDVLCRSCVRNVFFEHSEDLSISSSGQARLVAALSALLPKASTLE